MTVSPVRHIKDGLSVNGHSKALLRCVLQQLHDEKKITYFPSFEILIDELRDYRWYGEDLVHPSDETVRYICKRFTDSFIESNFNAYSKRINKIQKTLNHRFMVEPTRKISENQKIKLLDQLSSIQADFPGMDSLEIIKQKILKKYH